MSNPVIEARELTQIYPVKQGLFRAPAQLQAVNKVSFAVEAGRTLAVVGESGCGKSTLARMATLIEAPTSGALTLDGVDAVSPPAGERRRLRRTVQFVFQNPYGSLNPRKKVGTSSVSACARSRRGFRSGLCVESACAKCVASRQAGVADGLAPAPVPAGQERPAGSSRSITGRNDLSLMTGRRPSLANGHGTGHAQAARPFPSGSPASTSRPNREFVLVFSITTRTISPI